MPLPEWETRGEVTSSWLADVIRKALERDHGTKAEVHFMDYGTVIKAPFCGGGGVDLRIACTLFEPTDSGAITDPQDVCQACQLGMHDRCGSGAIDRWVHEGASEHLGWCNCKITDHVLAWPWAQPVHDIEQQSDGYRPKRP